MAQTSLTTASGQNLQIGAVTDDGTPPDGFFHRAIGAFFFNDTATTEISTLSLHGALPIYQSLINDVLTQHVAAAREPLESTLRRVIERKSTRLNSRHRFISYAVFCLK